MKSFKNRVHDTGRAQMFPIYDGQLSYVFIPVTQGSVFDLLALSGVGIGQHGHILRRDVGARHLSSFTVFSFCGCGVSSSILLCSCDC